MAVSDCIRTCRRCGSAFQRTAKGQPTKYCSVECRDFREPPATKQGACAHCGTAFTGRLTKTYCSSACKWAAKEARLPNRTRTRGRPRMAAVACAGCGITRMRAIRTSDANAYCSRQCYFEAMRRVGREVDALRRIKSAWQWRPSSVVADEVAALRRIARYVERPRKHLTGCRRCGEQMVWVRKVGGSQRICGGCKAERRAEYRRTPIGRKHKRIGKLRRRAIERGVAAERIDPLQVFERDRWTCQLCGKKTPRRLRGQPVDDAPELDHIIPLAVGGGHVWSNVQCACRACNGRKGAKTLGQLLLPIAA